MLTTYKYKEKTYTNIYPLSEALGKEGIFIPLSISDESLAELNVTVTHEEEPLEVIKQRKIAELKAERDEAEVTPIEYNGHVMTLTVKPVTESALQLLHWSCKARELQ